jgi:heme exporter protein A
MGTQSQSPALCPKAADPAVVELLDVSVDVGHSAILRDITLQLLPGGVIGVTGPNGSGKSTLLETLATLRRPSGGTGSVLGASVSSSIPPEIRRQICLVGHQPALYPQLSLRENLRFVAALFHRPERAVDEALSLVGLRRAADRRADRCSLGMTRRADLARVQLVEPSLLLLDEAHAGLDQAAVELIDYLVSSVSQRGGAAVVVAHDWQRLTRLADDVLVLTEGRLSSPREPV